MHSTVSEGDISVVVIIAIDITLGRASIDIAIDIYRAAVDGHLDMSRGRSAGTVAAAEDTVIGSCIIDTYGAAGNADGYIATDRAAGVAAAIHANIYGAATHGHVAAAHASLVAAAEDLAGHGTGDDVHVGCAAIFRLIAAAVDILVHGAALDVHHHGALRGTVDVVAAEDIVHRAAVDRHSDRAVDQGRDGLINACVRIILLTQTAAIDGSIDGARVKGYRVALEGIHACAAHAAQGRATIHVAIHDGVSVCTVADGHFDVAAGRGGLTIAAAEDHIGGSVAADTHGAVLDGHPDVAAHGAGGVASAIEA